jgi:hypothetical protein
MKLVGAITTHYHFDHTGGMPPPPFDSLGIRLPGVKELAEAAHVPVRIGCIAALGNSGTQGGQWKRVRRCA